MSSWCHIILTSGRNIVGGAPIRQSEALVLADLLSLEQTDRRSNICNLEHVLSHLTRSGEYTHDRQINVTLKGAGGSLYTQPISARSARMIVKAYRLNNEPGLQILVDDLRKLASGTLKPGCVRHPFLASEGFKVKAS